MYSGQARPVQKYDRKIKYLDYMENGVRSRGAGFIKLERRDGLCTISLQISGLYRRDRFTRPLLLLDGEAERELCRLQFAEGGIKICMERLDSRNLDGKGLDYEQVIGLRIPISEGKEIRSLWGMGNAPQPIHPSEEEPVQPIQQAVEEAVQPVQQAVKEPIQPIQQVLEEPAVEAPSSSASPENPVQEREAEEISVPPVVYDDKWTQLWAIYPHIAPFHDGREYMSMGPGDFVILPGRYYKLVNNSFLLHGYYNYHHLIMTRVEQRNGMKYYIGVPGNYYEREKKIAVMFGFESFECSVEPAEEGDFGYYMIPVEL